MWEHVTASLRDTIRVSFADEAAPGARSWTGPYLHHAMAIDGCSALGAGLIALVTRYSEDHVPVFYLTFTFALPLIWVTSVALARGYDTRLIGIGADEFRRIGNAGLALGVVIGIASYIAKAEISRGYMLVALPSVVCLDLAARFWLRKRLHRMRALGKRMRRAIAVGHPQDVAALITELRRVPHQGLCVVAACLAGKTAFRSPVIADVPVVGGLSDVAESVRRFNADTVAVLACPELNGMPLRRLAWELEKTHTELCLAPTLLDVAGPRTSVRAVAGLPLLYVDHPDLAGAKQVIKSLFDKAAAASVLIVLLPLLLAIAAMVRLEDGGPVIFRQTRMGKDGQPFWLYKFRTMVPDAQRQRAALAARNEGNGVLFKIRNDPRVTRVGARLRRWSLDELPQLVNVLLGQMSLVGPRPALPEEAARYVDYVSRRLAVRPGITGLWQVSGRSNLPWEEAVRLDLRYVENWSLVLDLQILWKTLSAVIKGHGAY
jgi:exopolysaccharide biosynthesis polyprenyl glycosylphosphotransferase